MKNCLQNFSSKHKTWYTFVIVPVCILISFSSSLFAQPHEYIFNGNLNEYNGGPALTDALACGASPGAFSVETAGTTSGACLTSGSFCFTDGGGLQYPNPGIVSNSYTINVLFRFSNLGGYARIIDFSNSASDAGIYFLGNCLNLYPNGNVGTCPYFTTNTYYLITFVRDGSSGIISVYVDGTLFGTYNDSGNLYCPANSTTPILFFRDDNVVTCENQPGCVKYISVSPNVATASDVTQTWNNITNVTHATAAPPPTITVAPIAGITCSSSSVSLSASSTGTMLWNGGSLSNAPNPATVSAPGTYFVTAVDANGCIDTAVVTVAVNNTPPAVTAVSSGNLGCSTSSVTLTGTSSGNTMTWNGGSLTNAANPATVSTPGTYTVTATDAVNGCTNTATVTVINDPSQQLTVTVNSQTVCSGQTATLTANGGTSYAWSTGATTNPLSVSPLATTSYTVTGTTGSCSDTAVATVTISSNLALTVNSPTICSGQTATLTAGGATSYSWSTGATTNPLSVSPASTASYTVTGTAGTCTGTAVATVTVNNPPVITVGSVTICSGQTATLTASGASSYLWSTGATTAAINESPASPVTYTVVGTTGGCADTAIASVAITPSPVITVNSATTCPGDTAVLTANGGSGYAWSTGATTTSIQVNPLSPVTYTVTGTMSGCTDTAVAIVTVNPLPQISVSTTSICNGGTGTITATGAASYVWSNGATGSQLTDSPVNTTTYTVTGTANGCSDTASGTITVNPFLVVDLSGATFICSGSSTTLTAAAQYGSSGSYTYSWAPSLTDTGSSATVSPAATTTYTVTVNDGCSPPPATDTLTVAILASPVVSFTADVNSGCAPLCVNFTNTSSVPGGTIATQSWDFGADQPTAQNCFSNPGQHSVTLTATSNMGCTSSYTNSNMITVVAFPVANFSAPAVTGLLDPVVTFTDNSTGTTSWNWMFDDSMALAADNISDLQNPTHAYSDTGIYCVQLIAGNTYGCYDTTVSCISIEPDFTCYIPGAFTPDDNDVNDKFYCIAQNFKSFEMQIYDRWGNLYYYTDDITKPWDGTSLSGDTPALMDIYIYKIHITDNRNKKHKYLGTVMLLR